MQFNAMQWHCQIDENSLHIIALHCFALLCFALLCFALLCFAFFFSLDSLLPYICCLNFPWHHVICHMSCVVCCVVLQCGASGGHCSVQSKSSRGLHLTRPPLEEWSRVVRTHGRSWYEASCIPWSVSLFIFISKYRTILCHNMSWHGMTWYKIT